MGHQVPASAKMCFITDAGIAPIEDKSYLILHHVEKANVPFHGVYVLGKYFVKKRKLSSKSKLQNEDHECTTFVSS